MAKPTQPNPSPTDPWQKLLTNLSPETRERLNRLLWQGKPLPAFWTLAAIFSLIINVALILILLFLGRELFALKSLVQDQLIGGLHTNFQKMDAANIVTTIEVNDTIRVNDTITVNDTIPVVFDLALQQETQVRLTKNTRLDDATIYLNGAPVALDIVLPKGTPLNIALDLVVPVNQQIPITLQVPVDLQVPVSLKVPVKIPLNQTELHEPFSGLQAVVAPYNNLLSGLPNSWSETPFCGPLTSWVCTAILGTP